MGKERPIPVCCPGSERCFDISSFDHAGEAVEEVVSSPEDNNTGPTTSVCEEPDGKDSEAEEDG